MPPMRRSNAPSFFVLDDANPKSERTKPKGDNDMKLKKHEGNPIFKPNSANVWEERCALNPAVSTRAVFFPRVLW